MTICNSPIVEASLREATDIEEKEEGDLSETDEEELPLSEIQSGNGEPPRLGPPFDPRPQRLERHLQSSVIRQILACRRRNLPQRMQVRKKRQMQPTQCVIPVHPKLLVLPREAPRLLPEAPHRLIAPPHVHVPVFVVFSPCSGQRRSKSTTTTIRENVFLRRRICNTIGRGTFHLAECQMTSAFIFSETTSRQRRTMRADLSIQSKGKAETVHTAYYKSLHKA